MEKYEDLIRSVIEEHSVPGDVADCPCCKGKKNCAYQSLVRGAENNSVDVAMECLGISREQYCKAEILDAALGRKYVSSIDELYNDRDFKALYVKCHMLHMACLNFDKEKPLWIREKLSYYYGKTLKFYPKADVREVPDDPCDPEQVFDYLMSYKLEWLVTVGW